MAFNFFPCAVCWTDRRSLLMFSTLLSARQVLRFCLSLLPNVLYGGQISYRGSFRGSFCCESQSELGIQIIMSFVISVLVLRVEVGTRRKVQDVVCQDPFVATMLSPRTKWRHVGINFHKASIFQILFFVVTLHR